MILLVDCFQDRFQAETLLLVNAELFWTQRPCKDRCTERHLPTPLPITHYVIDLASPINQLSPGHILLVSWWLTVGLQNPQWCPLPSSECPAHAFHHASPDPSLPCSITCPGGHFLMSQEPAYEHQGQSEQCCWQPSVFKLLQESLPERFENEAQI